MKALTPPCPQPSPPSAWALCQPGLSCHCQGLLPALLIADASGFSCSEPVSPCRAQVPSLDSLCSELCWALPALCQVPGNKPFSTFPKGLLEVHTFPLTQRAANSPLGMRRRQQSSDSQPSQPGVLQGWELSKNPNSCPALLSHSTELKKGEGTSFSQVTQPNTFLLSLLLPSASAASCMIPSRQAIE